MRYAKSPLRPGVTAIAAVLALSSTPLFAQSAEAPLVMPPPVTTAPAPAATTDVAPAPVLMQSSAPPLVTPPAPSIAATSPASTPASGSVTPLPAREPVARAEAPAPRPAASPAPRTTATRAVEAAPVAATSSPAPTVPAPVAVATPAPAAAPSPRVEFDPAPAAAPAPATDASDDILPIAGAAGAALLLLGGGAFVLMNRRRRDDDEDVLVAETGTIPADPMPMAPAAVTRPAPAMAATRPAHAHSAAIDNVPVTRLPDGFDLSRYGRHVQAAYRGPTDDNPSLSLRKRLARARFFDQRERVATEGPMSPPETSTAQAEAIQPAAAPRQPEFVTTRLTQPPRPGFRPAYSS